MLRCIKSIVILCLLAPTSPFSLATQWPNSIEFSQDYQENRCLFDRLIQQGQTYLDDNNLSCTPDEKQLLDTHCHFVTLFSLMDNNLWQFQTNPNQIKPVLTKEQIQETKNKGIYGESTNEQIAEFYNKAMEAGGSTDMNKWPETCTNTYPQFLLYPLEHQKMLNRMSGGYPLIANELAKVTKIEEEINIRKAKKALYQWYTGESRVLYFLLSYFKKFHAQKQLAHPAIAHPAIAAVYLWLQKVNPFGKKSTWQLINNPKKLDDDQNESWCSSVAYMDYYSFSNKEEAMFLHDTEDQDYLNACEPRFIYRGIFVHDQTQVDWSLLACPLRFTSWSKRLKSMAISTRQYMKNDKNTLVILKAEVTPELRHHGIDMERYSLCEEEEITMELGAAITGLKKESVITDKGQMPFIMEVQRKNIDCCVIYRVNGWRFLMDNHRNDTQPLQGRPEASPSHP